MIRVADLDLDDALARSGIDIDIPAAERNAYDFALRGVRERRNGRAVRQLEAIGQPPPLQAKQFITRARWVGNFGGLYSGMNYNAVSRAVLAGLIRSPGYSPAAIIRAIRGMTASLSALLPQLATTDLVRTMPRLDVPILMTQGRLDQVAPAGPAQRFHDALTAPSKRLVWFENSAHSPRLEEPGKFRDLLMSVRSTELSKA